MASPASSTPASPSSAASSVAAAALTPEQIEALVFERFMQYSGFGAKEKAGEIDGACFAKLCKETKIINTACTKTDVDLVFTRAKPKGGRKLNYSQFQQALLFLSEKRFAKTWKEVGKEAAQAKVLGLIAASVGPRSNATVPDAVRFHDDKSTYTGVYAQGGPTNIDAKITLSNLLDRSPSDARGRKM